MVHFTDDGDDETIAPVIPLFGGASSEEPAHPGPGPLDTEGPREEAEEALLRRLRTRQLSETEALAVLRERQLDAETAQEVIDRFLHLGYLDDAALAEQLVRSGVERKGQGRHALALALAKRGIPRAVSDEALATLPDDDEERALDFARTKARSMSRLDRATAERRLTGQLARRGYPSHVSLTAARRALDEGETPATGVRFR